MNIKKFKTIYLAILIPVTVIVCIVSIGYRTFLGVKQFTNWVKNENFGGLFSSLTEDLGDAFTNVKVNVNGVSVFGDLETQEYAVIEFKNIDMEVAFANVEIKEGNGYKVEVEYPAEYMPEVTFEGDMLKIKHTTKSYNVQLNKNNDCNITITVPKGTELGSVEITTDLGNVEIKDSMSFDKLEVTASLGNIEVESVKAAEIDIEADLGNVEIRKCDIDNINIKADLGDVSVKRCNFGTGDITNDLGAIEIDGEFNSLIASCSMGELDVKCDNISGAHMDLSADLGVVMVNGKSKGGSYRQ